MKKFVLTHYDNETKKIFNFFKKYVDKDLILTIKDRILSPKSRAYNEKRF